MKECIVLFDGECNLCNGTVQFIIKNDPRLHFRFAALQSERGKALLAEYGLQNAQIDSVVLIVADKVWLKSDAALRIALNLSGLWPLCFAWVIIPRPWRDHIYDFIARNRYKWFGKQESCWLPTPELRQRFLS